MENIADIFAISFWQSATPVYVPEYIHINHNVCNVLEI